MKKFFTTKRICRAGIIAALYVAFTYVFGPLPYLGIFQVRPAEALTILPVFFPEAIPALYLGCMFANITSPFWVYDVFIGALATLAAAITTWLIGKFVKKERLKIVLCGLPPVLFNAFVIPCIMVFMCGDLSYGTAITSYWTYFVSMLITQGVWVYALGIPFYCLIRRMRQKGVTAFLDDKKRT